MNKNIKKTLQGAMALGLLLPTLPNSTAHADEETVLDKEVNKETNAGVGRTIPKTNNITLHKRQYRQEAKDLTEEEKKEYLNRDKDGVIKKSHKDELGGLDNVNQRGIQNTGDVMARAEMLDTEPYRPDVYGEVEFTLFKLPNTEEVKKALTPTKVNYKVDMTEEEHKKWSQASSEKAKELGEKIEKAFDRKNPGKALPYGAKKIATAKVGKNGDAVFQNVATYDKVDGKNVDNLYVVCETVSPKTVVGKSIPMFLSLPVTNDDGSYKTAVDLYPKNKNEEQKVTMKKYGQDIDKDKEAPIKGARFKIYEGMPPKTPNDMSNLKPMTDLNGNELIAETDVEGKIDIKGLTRGNYFLVEQEVKNLVDGMEVDATQYKKREGFKYLAGYTAKANQYNVLRFCVDSAGRARAGYIEKTDNANYEDTIVTPDGTRVSSSDPNAAILDEQNILEYTNHEMPDFMKELVAYKGPFKITANYGKGKEKVVLNEKQRKFEDGWNYFEDIPFEVSLTVPKNLYQYSKFEFQDQLERQGNKDKVGKDKITTHAEYVKNDKGNIDFDVAAYDKNGKKIADLVRGKDYFIPEGKEKSNEFYMTFVNPQYAGWDAKAMEDNHKKGINCFSKNVLDAHRIKVRYKAQLNAKADPDVEYNNKAEFTYNNAPKGLTKDRYHHDGEKFETFGHRFIKKDSGLFGLKEGKQPLKGAEFIIRDKDGRYFNGYKHNDNAKGGQEPYFVEYKSDEEAYFALQKSEAHKDAILVSDDKGRFEVKGLKAGEYTAVEVKAPKGYALDLNPETKFKVGKDTYTKTSEAPLVIKNRRKEEMPITGGIQTVVMIAGGVAVLALVAYTGHKYMGSRKDENK